MQVLYQVLLFFCRRQSILDYHEEEVRTRKALLVYISFIQPFFFSFQVFLYLKQPPAIFN